MKPGTIALALALLSGCFNHTVEVIEAPPRYSTVTRPIPTESPLFSLEITEISAETMRVKVAHRSRCEETTLAIVDRKESSSRRPRAVVYVLSGISTAIGLLAMRENDPAVGGLALATGAGLFVSHIPFSKTTERDLPPDTATVFRTPILCQPGPAPGVVVRARSGAFVTEGQTNARGEVQLRLPLTETPLFFVQGDAVTPSGLRLPPPTTPPPQASPSSLPSAAPPRQRLKDGDLW